LFAFLKDSLLLFLTNLLIDIDSIISLYK